MQVSEAFGQAESKFNIGFEAGIAIVVWPQIFEVYIPLVTLMQITKIQDERDHPKLVCRKK